VCYQSLGRPNIILPRKCGIQMVQPRGVPAPERMLIRPAFAFAMALDADESL
jgi:hypothetical protein